MEKSGIMKADSNCSQIDEFEFGKLQQRNSSLHALPLPFSKGNSHAGCGTAQQGKVQELLFFVEGTTNSEKYIETVEKVIFPSVYGLLEDNFIF